MDLGRRERQIMDAVYRLGRATVNDVLAEVPDPPSYSAVRAMLGKLQAKGYLTHEQDGPRYVYLPSLPAEKARRTAMDHLVQTFFGGSVERAVVALLREADAEITEEQMARLAERISEARKEGK